MNAKLVAAVVPDGMAATVAAAARAAGASGGTVLRGRGTAATALLQLLGLGESAREIALHVVPGPSEPRVADAIRAAAAAAARKRPVGVLFTLDVPRFARGGVPEPPLLEEPPVNANPPHRLLVAIVNKGCAEDAMAAARAAGAGGGTVLSAHGTAKPDDATFFGVPIVPEKDTLLVLVPEEKADAVFDAVRALPCLAEKGSGVVFCAPVERFAALGGGATA